MAYPLHRSTEVPASPYLPTIEQDVLAYWKADGTFQRIMHRHFPVFLD